MTAKARSRIDARFNPVSTYKITPVRSTAIGPTLVPEGWFEFTLRDVAIAAETLHMAHAAEVGRLIGGLPVLLAKIGRVIKILVRDILIPRIVAFGTDRSALAEFRFRRMLWRREVTRFDGTAGDQKSNPGQKYDQQLGRLVHA